MEIKLGIISDCHLEFAKRSFYVPDGLDILLLAGDTHRSPGDAQKAIKELRKQTDLPIVYVCGNHEFYGRNFPNAYKKYKKLLGEIADVYFLEKEVAYIKGVRILGTTLWSDLSNPIDELHAKLGMNDYRYIKSPMRNYKPILPVETTYAFKENKEWIIQVLNEEFDGPTVILTHHLPSFQAIDPRFKSDPLTPSYVSGLDDIIHAFNPDVWIYGHSHSGLNIQIGKTSVISNPIGYPNEGHGNPMRFKEFTLVKEDQKK